jgi:hypothetical protein
MGSGIGARIYITIAALLSFSKGDQPLRWTATGLSAAEKKFRRVKGYCKLETLRHRLNPSLTQQVQVA